MSKFGKWNQLGKLGEWKLWIFFVIFIIVLAVIITLMVYISKHQPKIKKFICCTGPTGPCGIDGESAVPTSQILFFNLIINNSNNLISDQLKISSTELIIPKNGILKNLCARIQLKNMDDALTGSFQIALFIYKKDKTEKLCSELSIQKTMEKKDTDTFILLNSTDQAQVEMGDRIFIQLNGIEPNTSFSPIYCNVSCEFIH